jgi:hypothetical protein
MDTDQYCRDLEAHLCRRNEGTIVRVSGPAFDLVRAWAEKGIPIKVAMQGIDRCVDRALTRGPRRRPVRIEFCEADVLDAFDAWRRAVGVSVSDAMAAVGDDATGAGDAVPDDAVPAGRGRARESLSTHLDRVIVRLTAMRAGGIAASWDEAIDQAVRRLATAFSRTSCGWTPPCSTPPAPPRRRTCWRPAFAMPTRNSNRSGRGCRSTPSPPPAGAAPIASCANASRYRD